MLHYTMLIQWSESDTCFVVTLPEFDGAHTHGASYQEAARHGHEALELLIETYRANGRPLPAPRLYGATEPPTHVAD